MKYLKKHLYIFCILVLNLTISATNKTIKPPHLQKGDTVAIVAPAGFLKDKDAIKDGIVLLKEWGLNVVLGEHLFNKHNHFSGTDKERTSDLQKALNDSSIKAIWCARGGYGTNRVVSNLDFTSFLKNPKWIIGYSDITILHNAIHNLGVETIHGFMASSSSSINQSEINKTLKKALFGGKISYKVSSSTYNKTGNAEGVLVGGNLAILSSLLGTPYTLDTEDKILFFEDIGEYLYKIDRMVISLKMNGYFDNCKGIIIGSINKIPENDPRFVLTVEEIILNALEGENIPVLFDFPAGHIEENNSLIMGRKVSLKVGKKTSKVKFECE